ncbi:MAG: hypothetical protein M1366_05130 [Patescibacteria group bacterium]|nr:hypothetical protein [Patescibacteria group bacterium]
MQKWWNDFYKNNRSIVWAAVVGVVLSLGVLWKVPDEVTRFTLIMPIFAGFILFAILTTADEELDGNLSEEKPEKKTKTKKSSKK